MNPGDDLTTTEGINRALTRALFDCVARATADCLAGLEHEHQESEQVSRPIQHAAAFGFCNKMKFFILWSQIYVYFAILLYSKTKQ